MRLNLCGGCNVNEAAETHCAVKDKAHEFGEAMPRFALQEIVDGGTRRDQVLHKIGHAGAHRTRYHLLVAFGQWFERDLVDTLVDAVDRPVQGLPWV